MKNLKDIFPEKKELPVSTSIANYARLESVRVETFPEYNKGYNACLDDCHAKLGEVREAVLAEVFEKLRELLPEPKIELKGGTRAVNPQKDIKALDQLQADKE